MNKEKLLELGKLYYKNTNKIPGAKNWTKKAGYCSRDLIYKEFGNWVNFLTELGFDKNNQQYQNSIKKENKELQKISKIKIVQTLEYKTKEYWIKESLNKFNYKFSNKTKCCTEDEFIRIISKNKFSLKDDLNISAESVRNFLKRNFPDRNAVTQIRIDTFLLLKLNKKVCPTCEIVKDLTEFSLNKSRPSGYQSECKFCKKQYQKENIHKWAEGKAQRRIKEQLPISIFYKKELAEIYKNCPKGYQVDHIIPLNGEVVSGLHVPWNLQYLLPKENLIKSNKF